MIGVSSNIAIHHTRSSALSRRGFVCTCLDVIARNNTSRVCTLAITPF
jgi:hypothetical protein